MNINTVYRCPYYSDPIECPKECNSIQHATLANEFYATDKIYEYDPFFCDRDGVLIDNNNKSICRINIDADIEHSLQNAIDYISKCKVRGEKGELDNS